jgi:hypothetical protein
MSNLPDDPIVSAILRTGYPPWVRDYDDYDSYEDDEEDDDGYEPSESYS